MIAVFVAALLAQQPDPVRLVESLGSDSPAERDRASADLERLGEDAAAALRAGAASTNPEIAGRAADLLRRLRALELSTLRLDRVDCPFGAFGRADRLATTPDGKYAVGHDLEDMKVWELPSGRCVAVWRPHPGAGMTGFALAPDGARVLTWGHRAQALWETLTGRLVRRFESLESAPRAVAASPDGRSLGWVDGHGVEWVDAETGRLLWSRKAENGNPMHLGLRPDGRRLAVVSANSRTIEVLDARSGALLSGFDAPSTGLYSRIGYTRDGTGIVVTYPDDRKAWLFTAAGGDPLREGEEAEAPALLGSKARVRVQDPHDEAGHPGWVVVKPAGKPEGDSPQTWFLSADDRFLAIRTLNGRAALLYDAATGRKLREAGADLAEIAPAPEGFLAGTRKGELLWIGFDGAEKARVKGGSGEVEFVAAAGPGRALWRDGAGTLRCSDLASGRELWSRSFGKLGSFGAALAPDGIHAAGHAAEPGRSEQRLVRFELSTGRVKDEYASFEGYLAGVAFSPDGSLLAASTRDGPLAVWETESRKRLWELKPGKNARWLRFSVDSKSLFAGDDGGRLARLGARDGAEQRVYSAAGEGIRDGALSPDGRTLAVLMVKGDLLRFDVGEGRLLTRSPGIGHAGLAFVGSEILAGSPPRVVGPDIGAAPPAAKLLDASCDETRDRLAALHADRRFRVVELSTGKVLWEAKAPEGAAHIVLGAGAEYAVFCEETGQGIRVLRPGSDVPAATLEKATFLGAHAGKSALYTFQGGRLQRRDLATLALRHEVEREGTEGVFACGRAPWVLARIEDDWFRLDAETLAPIARVPELGDAGFFGTDPSGELLISGDGFRDGWTGKLRAPFPHDEIEGGVARFLDADGRRLRIVTVDGKVLTFGPRP